MLDKAEAVMETSSGENKQLTLGRPENRVVNITPWRVDACKITPLFQDYPNLKYPTETSGSGQERRQQRRYPVSFDQKRIVSVGAVEQGEFSPGKLR